MSFSIWDAIIFVAFLLILVVFRALDRNNRSLEKLKRFSDKITENLSAFVEERAAQVKDLSLEIQASLQTGREILSRARQVEEALQGRVGEIEAIQKRLSDYDKALAELTAMSARLDQNIVKVRDKAEFVDSIGKRIGESGARLDRIEKQIPELEAGFASRAREALGTARDEVVGTVEGTVRALSEALDRSEQRVRDFSAYVARLEARAQEMEREQAAASARTLEAFEADLRARLARAAQGGETLEGEVFEKLTQRIQENEAAVAKGMEALETRLADYQGDVDYRVKAFEETSRDIEDLRASLSEAAERAAAAARNEMKGLVAGLAESWKAETAGVAVVRERIEVGLAELSDGLADLKARAYQDVERKLSVFDEEFFADLRARSTAAQEKFEAWKTELEKRAAELESDVRARISASDESLLQLRETLRTEIEKARKESSASVEKELDSVRDAFEAGTRRMRREIDARLKELADAYALQKDELVASSVEERAALQAELAQNGAKITAFSAELARHAEAALEALRGQAESFQVESQKRMRDLQTEVEGKIMEYRALIAENREKAETAHEKLVGRIEESARQLSGSVGEIDKRVKNFMSQTRLFERADTLKAALEGTIDELKKEMAKLNAEKSEISEIEVQLSKTRKLADEVAGKLGRFLAEKRRIDEMEGEFKKIISVSRDVDLKLDSLSASNDALQQIQAKIRQFEELGRAVETGFERLEKKKEILAVTSEGVDRNFQRLEGIEKELHQADQEAESIGEKVQSLRSEYELLAGNKRDAETAMEIVGKLSGIIADLEQRMEKAQSSREWLARTETRFEEIGRQAQEQVRLMESIVKSETRKEKGDRGAPPMDKRETVVKLSHQGWSVQEISRVTQLSRGEVELILELAPKV